MSREVLDHSELELSNFAQEQATKTIKIYNKYKSIKSVLI